MGDLTVKLNALAVDWRRRAKKAFQTADNTKHKMGKRLVEHGAVCYANAAFELEKVLAFEKALESVDMLLSRFPDGPPIDHAKLNSLVAEKWPEIMKQNAALGLPVYERIPLEKSP